jgi:hypothetical protein
MTMETVQRLTKSGFILRDVSVRPHCLVLSVDQHPKSNSMFRVVKMLGNSFFEHSVNLLFQNTETW